MTRRRPHPSPTPTKVKPIPKPRIALPPGTHLRAGVTAALQLLQHVSGEDHQAVRQIRDSLRGLLAHTAAVGETCQVAAAVQAVRTATQHLDAYAPGDANEALAEALRRLPAEPVAQQPHYA